MPAHKPQKLPADARRQESALRGRELSCSTAPNVGQNRPKLVYWHRGISSVKDPMAVWADRNQISNRVHLVPRSHLRGRHSMMNLDQILGHGAVFLLKGPLAAKALAAPDLQTDVPVDLLPLVNATVSIAPPLFTWMAGLSAISRRGGATPLRVSTIPKPKLTEWSLTAHIANSSTAASCSRTPALGMLVCMP